MTSPAPDPGVYISPAQTLAEVRRIADGQIRMEGKLDRLLDDRAEDRETLADHEQRIRRQEQVGLTEADVAPMRADVEALKRSRWPLPTIAVLASLAGVAIALIPLLSR
ncbi:hypothetical protein ACFVVU_23745 [Kitasatospora sp. NPDC057965]|uniref:hypothetical protein n=1 Tax=Kitasatospora sp. NPDC057965 TaxID=3346291 RepID=UPI0036DC4B64